MGSEWNYIVSFTQWCLTHTKVQFGGRWCQEVLHAQIAMTPNAAGDATPLGASKGARILVFGEGEDFKSPRVVTGYRHLGVSAEEAGSHRRDAARRSNKATNDRWPNFSANPAGPPFGK